MQPRDPELRWCHTLRTWSEPNIPPTNLILIWNMHSSILARFLPTSFPIKTATTVTLTSICGYVQMSTSLWGVCWQLTIRLWYIRDLDKQLDIQAETIRKLREEQSAQGHQSSPSPATTTEMQSDRQHGEHPGVWVSKHWIEPLLFCI